MIPFGDGHAECNVDPSQFPTVERILRGTTAGDELIDGLATPHAPCWLRIIVRILRWYRKRIARLVGNRCVFEPSCSHYSELAFRKYGFYVGIWLTFKRLIRCRPGQGGTDWP